MRIHSAGLLSVAALGLSWVAHGPAESPPPLEHRIDVVLELKDGASIRTMDPSHVFAQGDLIRFRLRSAVNGFLYAVNEGSSGSFEQLFPKDSGRPANRVRSGKDYVIPASEAGWFRIAGPSGYETVYFLVSPTDIGKSLPAGSLDKIAPSLKPDTNAFATATPRCDDEMFRARGECIDASAGMKKVQQGDSVPGKFAQVPVVTSRDLVIVQDSKTTSVTSPDPFEGPAIYRFRVAHR